MKDSPNAVTMSYVWVLPGADRTGLPLHRPAILFILLKTMARQTGTFHITGTFDDLCFYRMEGGYYVRMRSSLTGKRFWKDAAFAGSRASCGLLAKASPLASRLYRQLPKEKKGRAVYQQLTGTIKLLLQQGCTEADIIAWWEHLTNPQPVAPKKEKTIRPPGKPVMRKRLFRHPPVQQTAGNRAGKIARGKSIPVPCNPPDS